MRHFFIKNKDYHYPIQVPMMYLEKVYQQISFKLKEPMTLISIKVQTDTRITKCFIKLQRIKIIM